MGKSRHTTLLIPTDDRTRLEEIARSLGFVQTRGAGAGGTGSISALICAIARGEYILIQSERRELSEGSVYPDIPRK